MRRILFLTAMFITVFAVSCSGQSRKLDNSSPTPKQVLIISSSPSKGGNSDLLCDEFMKGAQAAGHKVEKVFLNDLDIRFIQVKDDYSIRKLDINDDVPAIAKKMIKSDVIVLATPIYFDNMCGQMKTLIDRMFEWEHEIKNKNFYFIMTAGGSNTDCTLMGFRNFIRYLSGSKEKGVIYGTSTYQKGSVKGKAVMKKAYEMGLSI